MILITKSTDQGSSRLQPGDYDFEHFAHYAFTHTLEDYNITETNRRLKLPEYSGVHWDKDHDALDGPITSADKKYHDRLIKEGVYTNYMMYNGEKYYMPGTGGDSGGVGGTNPPPIPGGDGGITSTSTSSRPFQSPFDYHQGFTALSGGGGGDRGNINNISSISNSSNSGSSSNTSFNNTDANGNNTSINNQSNNTSNYSNISTSQSSTGGYQL